MVSAIAPIVAPRNTFVKNVAKPMVHFASNTVRNTRRSKFIVTNSNEQKVHKTIKLPETMTCTKDSCVLPTQKKRVVILGSGWGAVSIAKNLKDNENNEYIFVSPRNYMLYTPLLPSVVGGVVSENSIMEPIRNIVAGKGTYYEAKATDIDVDGKRVICDDGDHLFEVEYDTLVCSVGSVSATFGIPGVEENCLFLKNMEDARKLRVHTNRCIERAALPCITPEERKKLLSFVIVGCGPTGVETAAEIFDLVEEYSKKLPAEIIKDVNITLVDGMKTMLSSYDGDIQRYATELFERRNIILRFESFVKSVSPGAVEIKTNDGVDTVEFGTCVWSAGITMHPLTKMIKNKIGDTQDSNRGLLVDDRLKVIGAEDIICIGDAAIIQGKSLPPTAQVAKSQAEYIANVFNAAVTYPYNYFHKGSLVYLGDEMGALDLPFKLPFFRTILGRAGGDTYKVYETVSQVSFRTQVHVAYDWVRTKLFGRITI